MTRVLKRPQFLTDLAEELIWLQQKAGTDVAEAWHQSLKETIGFLEKHPFAGRERPDLSPAGIRSWRLSDFPRWLLFYGVDKDSNLVLYRIRQGMMSLTVLRMKS
jgi:plasmid stabilization system protein ParE